MFKKIALTILFILVSLAASFADTIILKDGGEYEGKVVFEGEKRVHLRMEIGLMKFYWEEIAEIVKDRFPSMDEPQTERPIVPFPYSEKQKEVLRKKKIERGKKQVQDKSLEIRRKELDLKRKELELRRKELEFKKEQKEKKRKEFDQEFPKAEKEIKPEPKKEAAPRKISGKKEADEELKKIKQKGVIIQPKIQGTGSDRYKTY